MGGFSASKLKAQLRPSAARISFRKMKKQNELGSKRRDIAQLLASGQEHRARIRVEDLIRDEGTIEAFDHLELYCAKVVDRAGVIEMHKTCPADMKEAVSTLIFAAKLTDIPELMEVRKSFLAKYGKDFIRAAEEIRPDCGVSPLIINKLSACTPPAEEKLQRLQKIAEEQDVQWDPAVYLGEIRDQQNAFLDTYLGLAPAKPQGPIPGQNPGLSPAPGQTPGLSAFPGQTPVPPPPRPFQPQAPCVPGQPTEMLLSPSKQQQHMDNSNANNTHNGSAGGAPGGGGVNIIQGGNPLDYPPPPGEYQDAKPLARDPMSYPRPPGSGAPHAGPSGAPPAHASGVPQTGPIGTPQAGPSVVPQGHRGAEEDLLLFPSVPRLPPKGHGGGEGGEPGVYQSSRPPLVPSGAPGAYQGNAPGECGGGMAGRGPAGAPRENSAGEAREGREEEGVFGHAAVFERRRRERDQRMREIMGGPAGAHAAAAGLGMEKESAGSTGGNDATPDAGQYNENKRREGAVVAAAGTDGLGDADSDFALPSPPHGWDAPAQPGAETEEEPGPAPRTHSPAQAVNAGRGGGVMERQGFRLPLSPPPPPRPPHPPLAPEFDRGAESHLRTDGPDPDSPLPSLSDLKAAFEHLMRRSKDMTLPTGY